jgi:hypothetical protein
MMSVRRVLLLAALVLVALLVVEAARAPNARRAIRAHGVEGAKAKAKAPEPYRVNVQEYEKLLPPRHARRSPLPHDWQAPNGGAPWQGGDVFEARPSGQQTRPIPLRAADDGPIAQTQAGTVIGYLDDGVNTWRGIPYVEPHSKARWQASRDNVPNFIKLCSVMFRASATLPLPSATCVSASLRIL